MKRMLHWLSTPYRSVKRSLFRKMLLAFLFILLLTTSLLGANYYVQTSEMIKHQAILSMERLSEQSESTLSSYMSNMRNFAWSYFGDPNFQQFVKTMGSDPDAFSYYLSKFAQFRSDNPMIDYIRARQLDGNQLMVGGDVPDDIAQAEWPRLEKLAIDGDGKGMWLTTVAAAPDGGTMNTLVFVQALKEVKITSRPIIGVFFLQLSGAYIREWLSGILPAEQGQFRLVRQADGRVIVAADRASVGQPALPRQDMERIAGASDTGYFTTREDGVKELVFYRKLSGIDWVLVGKVPVDTLLAGVRDTARRTVAIGFAGLLVSMLLASLLSSRIVVPLLRLRKGMKALEAGRYDVSVPVQTEDEVGYLTVGFNRMATEMNRMVFKVYEAELVKKEAEIRSLQSQINPHFLYNTLGTIDGLAARSGEDRIGFISRSLAKMFRYNISEGSFSTLGKEVVQIELYLSIQKIRFGDRLAYSIDVEEGLDEVVVPKLLVQPLVENSVLHGIDPLPAGGQVQIRIAAEGEDNVAIRVWNNGPPIDEGKLKRLQDRLAAAEPPPGKRETERSIGLANIQSRVRLLYGSPYGLTVSSSEREGTACTLLIHRRLHENGGNP